MKKVIFIVCVLGTLFVSVGMSWAEDGLLKQHRAFYNHGFAFYSQDFNEYELNKKALQRYGLRMMQERYNQNMKSEQIDWLSQNVWLYKLKEWKNKRQAKRQFIPRETVVAYLAILLEDEGVDMLSDQDIAGRRLSYENVGLHSRNSEVTY